MSVWAMVKEKTSFGPTTIILRREKEEERDHRTENREGGKKGRWEEEGKE